jgi:hypothetical protein
MIYYSTDNSKLLVCKAKLTRKENTTRHHPTDASGLTDCRFRLRFLRFRRGSLGESPILAADGPDITDEGLMLTEAFDSFGD